jgi:hypothetical protein
MPASKKNISAAGALPPVATTDQRALMTVQYGAPHLQI